MAIWGTLVGPLVQLGAACVKLYNAIFGAKNTPVMQSAEERLADQRRLEAYTRLLKLAQGGDPDAIQKLRNWRGAKPIGDR